MSTSSPPPDEPGPLLGPADVRELAAALGVRPTKQRGQNFVIDANTVRRIVRTAQVRPDDTVVEIGPGLGSLTLGLLEAAARVVAVEIDDVLAGALPATVAARVPDRADRFALVHSDAMRITELPGPPPTALVANLPYNVAVPVLLHMLERFPSVERVLVMVQSEVADRLAAAPGSKVYGVPSVKAAWYARVKRAGAIGRNVFWPAPNVDSGLVSLVRRAEPLPTKATREEVFAVVDAAFAQRRKTLRAALAGWAGSAAAAGAALTAAGISPQARGESLTVEQFAAIAEHKPVRAATPGGAAGGSPGGSSGTPPSAGTAADDTPGPPPTAGTAGDSPATAAAGEAGDRPEATRPGGAAGDRPEPPQENAP
ncbi:16S rRNA (adenine(1518)-N(6)/adenine(1519)-N(6))-dimethyltransferase RsmA [Streptomyces lycii]|uniref:Ribosomal RNA small subunit methyltransferase A n=1 Tax=Streptomyces lycii TaxID=2654337 RepID=A0ABQ7FA18_9ACTN|nr:16S rRNA (adenine(1518)-N(6)/adenine(1519)-N(6))-dimethyltransferase RsmA [Streptomyces lycii]